MSRVVSDIQQWQDIEVPIQPKDPPEMDRRDEDTQRAPLEPPLPASHLHCTKDRHTDQTVGKRSIRRQQ
jgi:hypothetical protein